MIQKEQLSIGDWVTTRKWREKPFQLTRINDSGKYYYGITAEGFQVGPFLIEELEPIPITPEILEKNGFRLIGEKFSFGEIDDDLVELNFSINNSYRVKISVADLMISHNGWIMYIHELQNALQLCEIEYEITL